MTQMFKVECHKFDIIVLCYATVIRTFMRRIDTLGDVRFQWTGQSSGETSTSLFTPHEASDLV